MRRSATIVANPNTRVVRSRDASGAEVVVGVDSPIKGFGLRRWEFGSEPDRDALAAAIPIINGDSNGRKLPRAIHEKLVGVGVLVPKRRISAARKFVCELAPLDASRAKAEDLVLAAGVQYEADGHVPAIYRERLFVEGIDLDGPTAWVENPATRMVFPFRVPARWTRRLGRLVAGEISAADLPAQARAAFHAGGILLSRRDLRAQRDLAARLSGALGSQLRSRGFTPPFDLGIPPLQLRALQRYYRFLADEGWFDPVSMQSPGRMVIHEEVASCFFHRQMAPLVSALVGAPWRPSYCYLARYRPGTELAPHTDREQCAVTISVQIEHLPRVARSGAWPLKIEVPADEQRSRTVVSRMVDGEGVAFRGTELRHSRGRLGPGRLVTMLLLHFVPEAFKGSLS